MNARLRESRRNVVRRLILDAAMELFVREGYESFSMRKLARKIDYSPGTVYQHFRSKEELFECLVEESFAGLLKTVKRIGSAPEAEKNPVQALRNGLRAYVSFGLRHANHYRFAFLLRPPVEKRPDRPHAAFDVLRGLVTRCVEQRRLRSIDVEMASQGLWAASHGITSLLIQRPAFPWVRKKELIGQVIDHAIDGLLPGATR